VAAPQATRIETPLRQTGVMGFTHRGGIRTPVLDIAYEEAGPPDGPVAVLSHGFPYDVRAYDEVAGLLAASGVHVIAPYLRGFGPTRFTDAATQRSGEQGALGQDLLDLLDGLGIERAVVGGYDWGGRASCIVAALHPARVTGLVTVGGYNVFSPAFALEPVRPEWERTYWYQYYFHSERGRRGLERNREDLCRLLWTTWSPEWADAATAFRASAPSLHNPDFVDVVIHSYRHRHGLVAADPRYAAIEDALAGEPRITVPTVVLESGADGVGGPSGSEDREFFTGAYRFRELPGIGHDLPQEAPMEFAEAVLSVL
jgi:pimeloyl-ACP methyl ester carboxylesterase